MEQLIVETPIKSADEIEKELLGEVNKTTEGMVEGVYQTYKMSLANFKANQHRLKSGRSKIRLLNLLMEYPLNADKLKLQTKDEQELFAYASNVLECKFLLLQYAYFMNGDKILKAVEEKQEIKQDVVEVPQVETMN